MLNRQGNFSSKVIVMSTAPLITQFLAIFTLPVITRIYSPGEFGVFNTFGSIVGVISVFAGMGYHQAIVLPDRDVVAHILFKISIVLTILLTIILYVISLIVGFNSYTSSDLINTFIGYKLYLVLNVLVHGLYVSVLGYSIRLGAFSSIAFSRITNTVVNKTFIIIVGLAGYAFAESLIIGGIIGSAAMSSVLIYSLMKNNIHQFQRNKPSSQDIVKSLRDYWQFPVFNIGADLIFRFGQAATLIIILSFLSAEIAGYYSMPEWKSFEIDNTKDLKLCEIIMKNFILTD